MPEFNDLESAKQYLFNFEDTLQHNFNYKKMCPKEDLTFFVIDNDYLLAATLIKPSFFGGKAIVHIRELTFNYKEIKLPFNGIELFKGLFYSYDGSGRKIYAEYMKNYPWIRKIMEENYKQWPGWLYNYIVVEMDFKNGNKTYCVGYTPSSPSRYLKDLNETLGRNCVPDNGFYDYKDGSYQIQEAYLSWKGTPCKKRFEKHARYYVISEAFKEKDDVIDFGKELLKAAFEGAFQKEDSQTFINPVNKWISEETLFKIISKLYGKKNVIYQYRPSFLKSSKNGQMSYDVFITNKNIAVEYQGKQHFEPVEIFGGEKAFKEVCKRDQEKRLLSEQNGIKLIYFYYYEELTDSLIKEKIENNCIDKL